MESRRMGKRLENGISAITYDTTSSSTSQTMTGIQNDLQPGYAKLKGGPEGDVLELEVTYTTFNK